MFSSFKISNFLFLIIVFTVVPFHLCAQQFHRIKADYSIKYKDAQGNEVLQMGVVFYDINTKKIVMKNGFPVREILVQKDSTIYQIRNEHLMSSSKSYALADLSIYHLALTGNLTNYGLNKAGFTLDTVKNDKGLILTTWLPPQNLKYILSKILLSTKEKQLFGIVYLNPNEKIIAKHLFRDYTNISGFDFPREVLVITYEGDKEVFNLTKYSKIVIDGTNNEEYYDYKIPSN